MGVTLSTNNLSNESAIVIVRLVHFYPLPKSAARCIILASGIGTRFQASVIPKHLVQINGIPAIIHTLRSAIASSVFSDFAIVVREETRKSTVDALAAFPDCYRDFHVSIGDDCRMQSFFNGLTTLSENIRFLDDDVFALVDANRPLVPASQFVDLYNLATVHGCSCPARPLVNGCQY